MKLGIVGAEGAKFDELGMNEAQEVIWNLINDPLVTEVCSGECHLGGADKWAHEIADELKKPFTAFPPAELNWDRGYKPRNLQIAMWSDKVVCITVDKLPPDFKGMKFDLCYHCKRNGRGDGKDHVKSGGCWTAFKVKKLGKEAEWITIKNES